MVAIVVAGCTSGDAVIDTDTVPTDVPVPTPVPPVASSFSPTPDQPHRLRMALDREPASLDPAEVREQAGRVVVDAVFDSLTRMPPNLATAQPAAAVSWTASQDLRTWTFELDPEATWHDGTPVVARDFVRALRHLSGVRGSRPFNGYLVEPLATATGRIRMRAPDDHTLVLVLPTPRGDLPVLLANPALAPRHPAAMEPDQPVGNGPFRMAEPWGHNQIIRLSRVGSAGDDGALDEVLLPIYAQLDSDRIQFADFRVGALDVAAVPLSEVDEARAEFGGSIGRQDSGVVQRDLATIHYLGFATTSSPWDDANLRRATSLLVDRQALVDRVGVAARTAASGIVAPGIPGGGVARCDHCTRDPDRARLLLDRAEVVPTEPVSLLTPDDPASMRVSTLMARSLEAGLGVPVVVDSRPLADYAAALVDEDFDLFLGSWTPTTPSMGGVLEPMLASDAHPLDNPGRAHAHEVDEGLARAATSVGTLDRLGAWQDAEQVALDEALVAPLYLPRAHLVVGEDVSGFQLRADGQVDLALVDVDAAP